LDLQEQLNSFLASRREILVLTGLLPSHTTQPGLLHLYSQQPRSDTKGGKDAGAVPRHAHADAGRVGEEVDEGEASYLSDAFESVASELLEYVDDEGGGMVESEEQTLVVQTVRQLATELAHHHSDPTGSLLASRQQVSVSLSFVRVYD